MCVISSALRSSSSSGCPHDSVPPPPPPVLPHREKWPLPPRMPWRWRAADAFKGDHSPLPRVTRAHFVGATPAQLTCVCVCVCTVVHVHVSFARTVYSAQRHARCAVDDHVHKRLGVVGTDQRQPSVPLVQQTGGPATTPFAGGRATSEKHVTDVTPRGTVGGQRAESASLAPPRAHARRCIFHSAGGPQPWPSLGLPDRV